MDTFFFLVAKTGFHSYAYNHTSNFDLWVALKRALNVKRRKKRPMQEYYGLSNSSAVWTLLL